jgi:hypothetical protein
LIRRTDERRPACGKLAIEQVHDLAATWVLDDDGLRRPQEELRSFRLAGDKVNAA